MQESFHVFITFNPLVATQSLYNEIPQQQCNLKQSTHLVSGCFWRVRFRKRLQMTLCPPNAH
jgi:hypothetical protein